MSTETVRRFGERCLLLLGILLLSVTGFRVLSYELFQRTAASAHADLLLKHSRLISPDSIDLKVAGKLEVPRLGLSVMVVEGDEEQGLKVAAVHLAGTAQVGKSGNAVIAGHRDTSFWPLRHLRVGDVIRFRGPRTSEYAVLSIRVVSPEDTSVLEAGNTPILTLVTCYPFRFVGSAPNRFVVRARLVS